MFFSFFISKSIWLAYLYILHIFWTCNFLRRFYCFTYYVPRNIGKPFYKLFPNSLLCFFLCFLTPSAAMLYNPIHNSPFFERQYGAITSVPNSTRIKVALWIPLTTWIRYLSPFTLLAFLLWYSLERCYCKAALTFETGQRIQYIVMLVNNKWPIQIFTYFLGRIDVPTYLIFRSMILIERNIRNS